MFESIRRPLVLLSVLMMGCADPSESAGMGEEASNGGAAGGQASSSGAPGTALGNEPGGNDAPPTSSDSSPDGGSATTDAGQPLAPPSAPLTCTRCATYADDQLNASMLIAQDLCNGDGPGVPESMTLYQTYLGCMCSGPCATECGSTLCALIPAVASPACSSCITLSNAVCGGEKSACLADQ